MSWLLLLGCLVLTAVPLLVKLGQPPALTRGESRAVTRTQQHWQRWQQTAPATDWAMRLDRLMPPAVERDGDARAWPHPGGTWPHLAAFAVAPGGELTRAELRFRGRLVSASATLLVVAGVYWAGYSVGGAVTALLAGLITGTMPLLIFEGRLATATMPLLATMVLPVAAALWAMRPFRPRASPWRQSAGWGVCGLALTGCVLVGGVTAAFPTVAALTTLVLLSPRRLGHALGLIAACSGAALLMAPWAMHLYEQGDSVGHLWLGPGLRLPGPPVEWAVSFGKDAGWLLLGVLPWSLWVIAPLWQPFTCPAARVRRRMLLAWGWFASMAAAWVLIPAEQGRQAVVVLLPMAGLLAGQAVHHMIELSAEGRHARFWRVTRWGHFALVTPASILLPLSLWAQPTLAQWGWLDHAWTGPVHWLSASALGIALLALAGISLKLILGHFPGKATVCWAIWTATASTFVVIHAADDAPFRDQLRETTRARERTALVAKLELPGRSASPAWGVASSGAKLVIHDDRAAGPRR